MSPTIFRENGLRFYFLFPGGESVPPGTRTLQVEVTNVSKHGFRLLPDAEELFVPFAEFPWFKHAPIAKPRRVERPQPHPLHWPDVDLAVDSIRHPERFPLVCRA